MPIGHQTSGLSIILLIKCLLLQVGKLSLIKQHSVITHAICQTEIRALLHSCVTNAPFVKILCPQKIASTYIFIKTCT
jgi:hypothetical protein